MEEVHHKLNTHERELAAQGAAIAALGKSVDELREIVSELPGQVQSAIEKVYRKIDANDAANRPQMKVMLAGGALLVSIFSVIITLVFSPITQRIYSLEGQMRETSALAATLEGDGKLCRRWNEQQSEFLNVQRGQVLTLSERIAQLESENVRLHELTRDIDHGGSRKWIDRAPDRP